MIPDLNPYVQAMIGAETDPLRADLDAQIKAGGDHDAAQDQRIAALEAAVVALQAGTNPPKPPSPPPSGVPVIPTDPRALLRYSAADTPNLGPLQVLSYLDDHPGDNMERYNRFRGHAAPTVANGFIHLRAVPRPDGLYDADFIGSKAQFGYGIVDTWARFSTDPGHWIAIWQYDAVWDSAGHNKAGSTEIDWVEMLENGSVTAHVHGASAADRYGLPRPADVDTAFHRYTTERRASYVAFSIDGTEVWRANGSMPGYALNLLFDACVGFPWAPPKLPLTRNPFLDIAGILVRP